MDDAGEADAVEKGCVVVVDDPTETIPVLPVAEVSREWRQVPRCVAAAPVKASWRLGRRRSMVRNHSVPPPELVIQFPRGLGSSDCER